MRDINYQLMKKEPNERKIAELVRQLLVELGEDPARDGLVKTPARVARSRSHTSRAVTARRRGRS